MTTVDIRHAERSIQELLRVLQVEIRRHDFDTFAAPTFIQCELAHRHS
jgi:hypothetical protein